VALPGRGMDTSWFTAVAPRIASSGYRVIAINPRGIGGSTGSLEEIDIDSFVGDTVAAIDALHLQRVHLLGWALGNRVSRAVAVAHPERVATVTLLAAGGKFPPIPPSAEHQRAVAGWGSEAQRPDSLKRYLPLFSPHSNPWPLMLEAAVRAWPEATAAQGPVGRAPLERWWSGGDKPMLVIQGLDDITAPPANGRDLRREFPARVELVELEQAGHGLLLEKPTEIAASVVQFLKTHPMR
jgi:pimeloyl-ACP methyl ester carboxylesterase